VLGGRQPSLFLSLSLVLFRFGIFGLEHSPSCARAHSASHMGSSSRSSVLELTRLECTAYVLECTQHRTPHQARVRWARAHSRRIGHVIAFKNISGPYFFILPKNARAPLFLPQRTQPLLHAHNYRFGRVPTSFHHPLP
jgi:hypothetical protein